MQHPAQPGGTDSEQQSWHHLQCIPAAAINNGDHDFGNGVGGQAEQDGQRTFDHADFSAATRQPTEIAVECASVNPVTAAAGISPPASSYQTMVADAKTTAVMLGANSNAVLKLNARPGSCSAPEGSAGLRNMNSAP